MIDNGSFWIVLGGLAVGAAFGALVQRSRFCLVAAAGNLVLIRDFRHVQAFLAALAVAVAGTQWLEAEALVAVGDSAYRGPRLDWFGASGGGLLFGFGAALAGGCAARTLVRAAEGSLAALLTLLAFAAAAAATQFGPLAAPRTALAGLTALDIGHDSSMAVLLGTSPRVAGSVIGAGLALAVVVLGRSMRDLALIGAGVLVGSLVVAAWWITGWLALDPFAASRPSALNISGPLARLALYVTSDTRELLGGFGVAFVLGTVGGATASALAGRTFHWRPPDPSHVPHQLIGGVLMGVGAIVAGGCNVGQGLSGVSTLSVESWLAAAAIFAGAMLGVKWLEQRE